MNKEEIEDSITFGTAPNNDGHYIHYQSVSGASASTYLNSQWYEVDDKNTKYYPYIRSTASTGSTTSIYINNITVSSTNFTLYIPEETDEQKLTRIVNELDENGDVIYY